MKTFTEKEKNTAISCLLKDDFVFREITFYILQTYDHIGVLNIIRDKTIYKKCVENKNRNKGR